MSTSVPVTNVCRFLNPNTSDFEVSDSSGDEWLPGNDKSDEDEEEVVHNKKKKWRKRLQQYTGDGSDDDVPLAQLASRRQVACEDDMPLTQHLSADSDSDDDIPLASLVNNDSQMVDPEDMEMLATMFDQPMWNDLDFTAPESTAFKGDLEGPPADGDLMMPYQYFKMLVTDEMLTKTEEETNMYAMQKSGIELKTTRKEIEIFIGMYLRMGLVQAHAVRAYWANGTRYEPVAGSMPRDRFRKLATMLHFTDNLKVTEEEKSTDKVWKLRPWITDLRQNLKKIPAEEHQAVDEIMVSFKGHSSCKQYMQGKLHPWGFKLWGRAGASGILYDFDIYQGSKDGKRRIPSPLGLGGDVVMEMTSSLEENKNYKIFADNFFSSLLLVTALKEKGHLFVGTFRSNRLKGCNLKSDKELKAAGRGSYDQKVEIGSNVIAVKWFDNKAVHLMSSYIGTEPEDKASRYDKKNKKMIEIPRPAIVKEYNQFMGGIDLLDGLTSLYKFPMKSRRWYMYICLHTICISVVTCWLWYKRHCKLFQKKPMKLSVFQSDVASALISVKRVGRSSLDNPLPCPPLKKATRPVDDVRMDGVGHLPEWTSRNRCMMKGCTAKTFIRCVKCRIMLCCNKGRDCFLTYHTQK